MSRHLIHIYIQNILSKKRFWGASLRTVHATPRPSDSADVTDGLTEEHQVRGSAVTETESPLQKLTDCAWIGTKETSKTHWVHPSVLGRTKY